MLGKYSNATAQAIKVQLAIIVVLYLRTVRAKTGAVAGKGVVIILIETICKL